MALGVQKSLEAIKAIQETAVTLIQVSKDGLSLGDIPKVLPLIMDLKTLIDAAPQALPELKDLDAQEIGLVSEAAYVAVKAIVEAVTAK